MYKRDSQRRVMASSQARERVKKYSGTWRERLAQRRSPYNEFAVNGNYSDSRHRSLLYRLALAHQGRRAFKTT